MIAYNSKTDVGDELKISELVSSSAVTDPIQINGGRDVNPRMYEEIPKEAPLCQSAIWMNPSHAVLPCKGAPETVRFGRFERSKSDWMYPNTGYARKQPLGLAYDRDKPINRDIMPKPGFYNVHQRDTLGNLK
jgi:hypothetical protein